MPLNPTQQMFKTRYDQKFVQDYSQIRQSKQKNINHTVKLLERFDISLSPEVTNMLTRVTATDSLMMTTEDINLSRQVLENNIGPITAETYESIDADHLNNINDPEIEKLNSQMNFTGFLTGQLIGLLSLDIKYKQLTETH